MDPEEAALVNEAGKLYGRSEVSRAPSPLAVPYAAGDAEEQALINEAGRAHSMGEDIRPQFNIDPVAPLKATIKFFSDSYQRGEDDIVRMSVMSDVVAKRKSYEEAATEFDNKRMDQAKAADIDAHFNSLPIFHHERIFGGATRQLPFMLETTKGGLAGGAVYTGLGVAASTAVGGGALTPLVAKVAFPMGYKAGVFDTSSKLMAGGVYDELRQRGASDETARHFAIPAGIVSGALEGMQYFQLGAAGKRAAAAWMKGPGRNATAQALIMASKELGQQVTEEEGQQLVSHLAATMAAFADKNDKIKYSEKEMSKNYYDTLIQTLEASLGMLGAAKVGGMTVGVGGKVVSNTVKDGVAKAEKLSDFIKHAAVPKNMSMSQTMKFIMDVVHDKHPQPPKESATSILKGEAKVTQAQAQTRHAAAKEKVVRAQQHLETVQYQKEQDIANNGFISTETEAKLTDAHSDVKIAKIEVKVAEHQAALHDIKAELDDIGDREDNRSKELLKDANAVANRLKKEQVKSLEARIEKRTKPIDKRLSVLLRKTKNAVEKRLDALRKESKALNEVEDKFNHKTYAEDKQRAADRQTQLTDLSNERAMLGVLIEKLERGAHSTGGPLTLEELDKVVGTKRIQNMAEIRSLLEERETMEQTKELINDPNLKSIDLKDMKGSISFSTANQMASLAASKVIAANKKAGWNVRNDLNKMKTLLGKVIKSSGLPDMNQKLLLDMVNREGNPANLATLADKIETRINNERVVVAKKAAVDRLSGIVKTISRTDTKGLHQVAKYQLDAQVVLNNYGSFVKDIVKAKGKVEKSLAQSVHDKAMADQQAMLEAQDFANTHDSPVPAVTPIPIDAVIAGDVISAFTDGSAEALNALADKIETIAKTGRDLKLEQRLEEQRVLDNAKEIAIRDAQGNKPLWKTVEKNGELVRVPLKKPKGMSLAVKTHGETMIGFDVLAENIFADTKSTEAQKLFDVHEEVQTSLENIDKTLGEANDIISGGDNRVRKLIADVIKHENNDQEIKFYAMDQKTGYVTEYNMSRSEAIQWRNRMKNPNRWKGLAEGNGFTFADNEIKVGNEVIKKNSLRPLASWERSFQQELDEALIKSNPKLITIADNLMKFYAGDNFDRLNEAYTDEFGRPLARQEFYDGYGAVIGSPEEGTSMDLFNKFSERGGLKAPGMTVSLSGNSNAYRQVGAFSALNGYVRQTENWMAFRKKDKILRTIMSDNDFREIVRTKFHDDTLKIMDHSYASIVGSRSMQHVQQNALFSRIRNFAAVAYTGAKAINALAQVAGVLNYAQGMGPLQLGYGVAHFFATDTQKNMDRLGASKYLKNRAGYMNTELTEQTQKLGVLGKKGNPKLLKTYMYFISTMDEVTHFVGGHAAYLEGVRRAKKEGLTGAAAEKAGIDFFERLSNRTQGSSTPDQLTYFERGGDANKAMAVFGKQPTQAYMSQVMALRGLMRAQGVMDKTKATAKLASIVIAAHAAQAAFDAIRLSPALTGADDNARDEAMAKVFRSGFIGPHLPLVGTGLDSFGTLITNRVFGIDEHSFDPKFMVTDTMVNAVKVGEYALKIADGIATEGDFDMADGFRLLDAYYRSFALMTSKTALGGGGFPGLVVSKEAKKALGVTETPEQSIILPTPDVTQSYDLQGKVEIPDDLGLDTEDNVDDSIDN